MSTVARVPVDTNMPELQHELVLALRGVGRQIPQRPAIIRALDVADRLKAGMVVASDEQAVELADLVAVIIDGEKDLGEQMRVALQIPKAMEDALRDAVSDARVRLAAARNAGNGARVTWQETKRQRAKAEEERQRKAAEEAAAAAAARAEETGDDAPPPLEVAPVEVPRIVAGGVGKMGVQVRIVAAEIVDYAKVPRQWVQLVPEVARASFLADARAWPTVMKRPEPGESVVYKGVRFEAKESAVNRR
jgi:hypothetical protein